MAARALVALTTAGSRGLSQLDVQSWTAQLGSAVRDLRGFGFEVEKLRWYWQGRVRVPTRYVLESPPDFVVLHLVPRGGVL
jgi:hypothetical protein